MRIGLQTTEQTETEAEGNRLRFSELSGKQAALLKIEIEDCLRYS